MTIEAALAAYVERLRLERRASAEGAASIANKLLGRGSFTNADRFRLPGAMALERLVEADLMALRTARLREGNGPQTIAHELKTLRAAALYARSCGEAVPSLRWRIPAARQKTRHLSQEEWQRIFTELEPHRLVPRRQSRKVNAAPTAPMTPRPRMVEQRTQTQDLLIALTLTGGRWSEIRSLTANQLTDGGLLLWGNKTQKARLVPCPPVMAEALIRRRQAAEALGSVYLFPGLQEGPQRWSGALRRAFERAGVNAPHIVARQGRATIHSLRHTFASWLIQDGMSLAELQILLGHTTLQMTRRYAHLGAAETVARAAERLTARTSFLFQTSTPPTTPTDPTRTR